MKIHDLSIPIRNNMPVWPTDLRVNIRRLCSIESGADANVTAVEFSVHTGTHIDAPVHFVDGRQGIEELDLNLLTGEVEVVEIDDLQNHLDLTSLQDLKKETWPTRLIFKTSNTTRRLLNQDNFTEDYVALMPDAAKFLVENGVRLVGVDYLSVAPYEDSVPTHKVFLEANVILIEGLNLIGIEPGIYELVALPIKIEGSDGAPARVILIEK